MSQKYNPFLNTKSPRSMDTSFENTAEFSAVFFSDYKFFITKWKVVATPFLALAWE